MFAILIGRGFASLWARSEQKGRIVLAGVLIAQGSGVVMIHPFGLSYFNALIGGLPGAERSGMELTYWGDAVDATLLAQLAGLAAPGETAALAPTLAPDQGKVATTRELLARGIILEDQARAASADWLVISRREAYWSPEVKERLKRNPSIARRTRQGVWLSAILGPPRLRPSP